ncbi:MAG TPA: hypothetical protein VGM08_04245 [Candidatus Saccharimonadales bacterium]|jgi:hypothetical protein
MAAAKLQPKPKPKLKQKPKSKRRILRIIAVVIVAGVVVVPAVVILLFWAGTVIHRLDEQAKERSAEPKIAAARAHELPQFEQEVASRAAALKAAGVTTGTIASSEVDVCYLANSEIDEFNSYWYQGCYLRAVEGFATPLTESAALQKLAAAGLAEAQQANDALPCELTGSSDTLDGATLYHVADTSLQDTASDQCGIPDQLQGADENEPLVPSSEASVKSYKRFNPSTVNNTVNQVWIQYEISYYHEDLGCAGLFCDSPRGKPVQAP